MDQFGDENVLSIQQSLPYRFTDRRSVRKTTSISIVCKGHFSPFVRSTGRNYTVSYWRKILQYIHHRLEEITPLVSGVQS